MAFSSCPNLVAVKLPITVSVIGEAAFGHVGIASLDLKVSGPLDIQYAAFYSCLNLTSVSIEAQEYTLRSEAFSHCRTLVDINLGAGLRRIHQAAFHSTPATEIHFEGTVAKWRRATQGTAWSKGSHINKVLCKDGTVEVH